MDEKELEKMLAANDRQFLSKNTLPEHDKLINIIRELFPATGIAQNLFCNSFMLEAVELIKHSIFLYEEGFFDCAFYSLRQSIEILNNMLLCADDDVRLKNWKSKGWFPSDKNVKETLKKQNIAYREIKSKLPEFFEKVDINLQKANKYIHKQGFDTFYTSYKRKTDSDRNECTNLFLDFIRQAIGMVLIMNIALDPLALALSDPDVEMHIPFDPMTEPIPIHIFEELLSMDILEKIKDTKHYKELKEYFLSQEELNEATYEVIHYQHFDIHRLKDIEKQSHLLDIEQKLILHILLDGINASYFYPQYYSLLGYSTSYKARVLLNSWSSDQFDEYLGENCKQNIPWNDMYISVFQLLDSYLVIQHNDIFKDEEIHIIETNVNSVNQQYTQLSAPQYNKNSYTTEY